MPDDTAAELRHSPLEAEHRALGAKMISFGGWLMPLEYSGTLAEHRAVRESVGLFDLTHLGKIIVEGPGALAGLQRVVSNDLGKVAVDRAQYNLVLDERGGIVDDLIVYRIAEHRYLVVPNAANSLEVHGTLLEHAPDDADVVLREDLALIAPQGPACVALVERLFPQAASLSYMSVMEVEEAIVSRSGYTGERGFELFVPERSAVDVWRRLLRRGEQLGVRPCGLGARDTLRLEMGYPLHGNDISKERTPLEAGLSWAVSFDKEEFVGRQALVAQKQAGIPSRLWGLRMLDRLIPRAHYPVLSNGERVGETTSGGFSPTLKSGIAMAYLSPSDRFSPGDNVQVDVRGRLGAAEVVKPPFVGSSPK